MRSAGFAARVWRMFQPCFRAVDMTDRMRGEGARAGHGSEAAGDFHLDLHHSQVPLGLVVGEGDGEVSEESQDIAFELVQPDQEIVSGAMGARPRAPIALARGGWFRWKASPRRTMALVAFDQGAQNGRRQRRRAFGDGGADAFVGLEEKIAHLPGPLLLVDVDQGLEFAQMMGVA